MVCRLILSVLLLPFLASAQTAVPAAPEPLYTESHDLEHDPNFEERAAHRPADPFGGVAMSSGPSTVRESNQAWAKRMETDDMIQGYFAKYLDLTFPEGSWIRYEEGQKTLSMHNTAGNHFRLCRGLAMHQLVPYQIQIDVRVVSFDSAEIDLLERKGGPLSDQAVVNLWQGGKGKTLYAQGVRTINGVNAIIESVKEILYPTEASVGTNGTAFVYGGHETRKTGYIFNVTPTVGRTLTPINLTILPDQADLDGTYPHATPESAPMNPIFNSRNLTTNVITANGGTTVIGNSSSLDGKERLYFFIGATLVDAKGAPLLDAPRNP